MELMKVVLSFVMLIFFYNTCVFCNADFEEKQDTVSEDDSDTEIFKPTFEWQEVKKNQRIPKGLHVQLDLQTGVRRAKLLAPTENQDHTSLLQVPAEKENEEIQKTENSEKTFPINLDNIGAIDPETLSQVKQKHRSYMEIKQDLKDLELGIKTDLEMMNDLMEKFEQVKKGKVADESDIEETWLNTLLDLEYLVHQVDNARLFTNTNGIKNVVFPSRNSTSSKIRAQGARLLGGACQNNVPSQITALESGAIRELLHTFSSDPSSSVQSSALYALSCIIRNFPVAQKMVIDTGGLEILNSVFDRENSEQLKLQVKVVTLINDLLLERRDVEETLQSLVTESSTDTTKSTILIEETKEKQRQLNLVNLEANLLEHQWCQHLANILLKQISVEDLNGLSANNRAVYQLNHDNIEKIIKAMSVSGDCENEFKADLLLKKTLSGFVLMYKELSDEEINEGDTDGYYTGLKKDIENVLSKLL